MILSENYKAIISKEIHAAELRIEKQIGRRVRLRERTAREEMAEDETLMIDMLGLVAKALGMTMDDYFEGRYVEYVDLRTVAAILIREKYPLITYQSIASSMGLRNHTTVLNMLLRGRDKLYMKDTLFTNKYKKALYAVENWEKKKSYATGKDSDLRGRAVGSAGER